MFGDAKFEVVRPETVRAPEELERPEPSNDVKSELLRNNDPTPNDPVVVALPTMVDDAVERKPLVSKSVVDVPAYVDGPAVDMVKGKPKVA